MKTLKYDSLGNNIFTASYSNGSFDSGNAIKVDAAGNVYVTGISYSSSSNRDYVTVKYSPTGTQLWLTKFNGTGNNIDEANDLKLDASGNVYVTGKSLNTSGNYDIVTVKYNNSGVQQWANVYNGSSNKDDIGVALVISSNGSSVFITGTSTNASLNTDIITLQLNASSGAMGWKTITNGSANSTDVVNAITLSGANVVVCGYLNNTTTGNDYCTIKYNGSSGSAIWQKSYDFGNGDNRATALVKDSTGNIGVTGTAKVGSLTEIHTLLYDSTGTQLWVNKEATGLSSLNVNPKIATDTIANHFYVSGQIQKASADVYVYQITPTGNTTWKQTWDGTAAGNDAATNLCVNGVGVVYLSAQCKNVSTKYDYTTIKISQTPVYFPPDLGTTEVPSMKHLFYENKGQYIQLGTKTVASDVLFATMDEYPFSYYNLNRISYKFKNFDTLSHANDTTQRIDITMTQTNPLTHAYPFDAQQGLMNFMDASLPTNVTDVQGYTRYMIPNIYPYIDLHYYSNEKGLKMYYVLKPHAKIDAIKWQMTGATSTTISGTDLQIQGFNHTVIFDQPTMYSVNSVGQATAIGATATWTNLGSGLYGISTSTYNANNPIIIEIDNGNPVANSPQAIGNMDYMSFYGGALDEGFRSLKVDKKTGYYATIGTTNSWDVNHTFPISLGTNITTSVSSTAPAGYIGTVLFNKNGARESANIYGIPGVGMAPIDLIINYPFVTIIGNCASTNTAFPITSTLNLTPGTYTNVNGRGYLIQFQVTQTTPFVKSMNQVKWFTRLNGSASGLAMKPNSKEIYLSSTTNTNVFTPDLMNQTGSSNLTSIPTNEWHGQISKFDSLGIRKWSSFFQAGNSNPANSYNNGFGFTTNELTVQDDERYNKFKIDCDNYGFALTGEVSNSNLLTPSKYSVAMTTTFSGVTDAFVSRFNSKDSIVFATFVGGSGSEVFNSVKITAPNEITVAGYSTSQEFKKITKFTNPVQYIDTIVTPSIPKILINKFDTIGNRTWGTLYGGNTTATSNAWAISNDNLGKIYVGGWTNGSINMLGVNSSSVYSKTTSRGQNDTYILSFDSYNGLVWNSYIGGQYNECTTALDFNPFGNRLMIAGGTNTQAKITTGINLFPCVQSIIPAYYSAWWTNSINSDFNGNTVFYGPGDAFVGWFNPAIPAGIKEYFNKKDNTDLVELFPNPTSDQFFIALDKSYNKNVTINVYNQLGQLILTNFIATAFEKTVVPLNSYGLKNGIYIVTVFDETKSTSKKLIITGK
jgi:hypothetical protein